MHSQLAHKWERHRPAHLSQSSLIRSSPTAKGRPPHGRSAGVWGAVQTRATRTCTTQPNHRLPTFNVNAAHLTTGDTTDTRKVDNSRLLRDADVLAPVTTRHAVCYGLRTVSVDAAHSTTGDTTGSRSTGRTAAANESSSHFRPQVANWSGSGDCGTSVGTQGPDGDRIGWTHTCVTGGPCLSAPRTPVRPARRPTGRHEETNGGRGANDAATARHDLGRVAARAKSV